MSEEHPDRALLTMSEAARQLNVEPDTIKALVTAGKIPVVWIGGARRNRRIEPHVLENLKLQLGL